MNTKNVKILALALSCLTVLSLSIFEKVTPKVTSETHFSSATADKSRNLKNYFIIKVSNASGDEGYSMSYKDSSSSNNNESDSKITDKNGKLIDSYEIDDTRGAWVSDIFRCLMIIILFCNFPMINFKNRHFIWQMLQMI
ncbi:hypothetical protein RyT2_04410 [Pseudolactococcus yaeyamensis]